ncbi:hypothetical protein LOC54_04210 [Acetobacter sp. AN02]|nr:hypothetical protein [Acetobacter sp. AN02]MDG6094320.1 hypothetical protein [Acetobacter sp. AN02]
MTEDLTETQRLQALSAEIGKRQRMRVMALTAVLLSLAGVIFILTLIR